MNNSKSEAKAKNIIITVCLVQCLQLVLLTQGVQAAGQPCRNPRGEGPKTRSLVFPGAKTVGGSAWTWGDGIAASLVLKRKKRNYNKQFECSDDS